MRFREPKEDDQENIQKAYELLMDLIEQNERDIEAALWVGAMICALAENYEKSGISFQQFKTEISQCVEYYKY